MLHRQIEMFAGVAASSMPAVNRFFTRRDFSIRSWRSSLKSSLRHLLSSPAREKLSDRNSSLTGWGRSNMHASEDGEGSRMKVLGLDGCDRKTVKAPRVGDSQIHLTPNLSVTQDRLDDSSFRHVVTGCHH